MVIYSFHKRVTVSLVPFVLWLCE